MLEISIGGQQAKTHAQKRRVLKMKIGTHTAKRTGINAEFRKIIVNGDPMYLTKIENKIYKFSEQEFIEKWKPAPRTPETVRQGKLELNKVL